MTRGERAELAYMHPGRVDVMGAGGLVWRRILERLNELTAGRIVTATASEHDILDGIALSLH
jgi:exopolyphosphatase/guanosine-5'-triphosphate,3'-diphosphate pyrophosphatase